jgi:tetratricopeptide (TPR) repeat protein
MKTETSVHNHNKIILLLMIKNESKIIERCLGRALEHVDAVSILDTGSTDNTVEVCEKYLSTCGKPFKISVEPFKNFGYNRTVSYQKTQEFCRELGWDSELTYTMAVDADMIIKPSAEFKNYKMTDTGYRVIQQTPYIKYHNLRFMRCNYDWKCIGSTHEYWSGEGSENIPYEVFYIDDINDGGCKSDKFERDIRLLTEDLKDNPENPRSHFYLAQSYKDSGKFNESIQHYKERIKLGGWYEEVWSSHYQIAKCYESLKESENMEAWALKAFKIHPKRSEPLYLLVKHFKDKYEHFKAYQYYLKGKDIPYPKDDVLFIEHNVYNGLFDYESTILSCYIFNKTRQDSLLDMVNYINNKTHHVDNVWDNTHYYIETLTSNTYRGTYTPLLFPDVDEYKVSSCSMIPFENKLLMNTRYVNYGVDGKGGYPVRSADGVVRTKNAVTFLNNDYRVLENPSMLTENLGNIFENNSPYGLEDVRIFNHGEKVYFNANSKNYKESNSIVSMVLGEYNFDKKTIDNVKVIESPYGKHCEKNWIYIPEESNDKMNFIYNWHPLEIGSVNDDNSNNKLIIHKKYDTPKFFSRLRGSSNMIEYNGRLWCLTHYVKYSTPRIYYHSLVGFNRKTIKPEMYSLPFAFRKLAIEYCLTIHIKNDDICFIFSQGDSEPGMINMPFNNLRFVNI